MKKNQKILIGALLAIAVVAVLFFALQPPSFESEYARMSQAWKANGVHDYYLHRSRDIFSLKQAQIERIKSGLISVKNSSENNTIKELAGVYLKLIDFSDEFSKVNELKKSLSGENVSFCDNQEKYNKLLNGLSSLEEKKQDYLMAVNAFVSKNPEIAEKISLFKTELSKKEESIKSLRQAIEILKMEC